MEFYFGSGTKINVNTEGVEKVKTLRALISDEIGKPTRRIELLAHNGDKLQDSTSLTDLDPQMPVTVFILPPAEPGTLLLTLEGHTEVVSSAVLMARPCEDSFRYYQGPANALMELQIGRIFHILITVRVPIFCIQA